MFKFIIQTIIVILAIIGIMALCIYFFPDLEAAEVGEVCIPCIIMIESGGNPYVVSEDSCVGMMGISRAVLQDWNENKCSKNFSKRSTNHLGQIIFEREDVYSFEDLFNPVINIKIGTWYINIRIPEMLKAYKIEDTILTRIASYNWGINNVKKWYRNGAKYSQLPRETKRYYEKYLHLNKSRSK